MQLTQKGGRKRIIEFSTTIPPDQEGGWGEHVVACLGQSRSVGSHRRVKCLAAGPGQRLVLWPRWSGALPREVGAAVGAAWLRLRNRASCRVNAVAALLEAATM